MNWEEWFQNAWTVREEQFYQSFFGPNSGGIYPLDHHVFAGFAKGDVDPRWLTHGVIKFPPTTTRRSWLYATSGLSNAWDDEEPNPDGWSGLGCELIIEASADFDWALSLLRRLLAFQILLGWGRYEGKEPLVIGDRIPLRNSIDGEQSPLTWCLVAPPVGYPAKFQLPSGNVEFLHLVGVTEVEAQFAKENGYEELLRRMSPVGYPVTKLSNGTSRRRSSMFRPIRSISRSPLVPGLVLPQSPYRRGWEQL